MSGETSGSRNTRGPMISEISPPISRVRMSCWTFRRDWAQDYVDARDAWLPGLCVGMMDPMVLADAPPIRIYRDDFPTLRDIYIQGFELLHKALTWMLGAINTALRGSRDDFGPPIPGMAARNYPNNLAAFKRQTNFLRAQWFRDLPEWNARWPTLLDRRLRNDIGHASAHHDLAAAFIVGDQQVWEYTDFARRCALMATVWTAVVEVIATFYVVGHRDRGVDHHPPRP